MAQTAAAQAGERRLESHNPATGELLGSLRATAPGEVQPVVDGVAQVQPLWAALPLEHRGRYLRRAAQIILDRMGELRDLIVREQGRPRAEAYTMELLPAVDALHWVADAGTRILADERVGFPQVFLKGKRGHLTYEPVGVVGVIAPWNHPWSVPLGEAAVALMAGNGVVLKPAEQTCLIGQRIEDLFARAGLPEGLLRAVHGDGAVGAALVESSAARIFFTGSVEVGRGVAERCARALKRSVLELGGKDPMLVLPDANLRNAVAGGLWGAFANAGQAGAAIERVYVHRDVAEPFTAGVVEGARALRVGDPLDWSTAVGPMISRERRERVDVLVRDAVERGATLECGGPLDVAGLAGAFYAPAVLTGVRHDMRIMREELLGPVLPILAVESEEEAIARANDSAHGLGASVWTRDRAKGERIAREIESGMVWVNDHMFSHGAMQCSWGGIKDSGVGLSHSKFGFYECVNVKQVTWEPSLAANFWWHPYDETLGRAVEATAWLVYGRESDRARVLRDGAGPLARVAGRAVRDLLGRPAR
jgi:acyl-CoA reductase-like NAD-dependent aldehyde dehydrogenase